MARPTARVLALLEVLQSSSGTRTVADLAARLDVDERTVRRYVAHLLDLDIPVESVRGRYGGYRLAPGYRLPPLMLTDDEAVAVLLGLATSSDDDGGSALAAQSATAKVRRVLPKPLAVRLDALLDVADLPREAPATPPAEAEVLLLVAEAARARRGLEIVHVGRDGRTTERTVHPYGVVAHAGRWYLVGHDERSAEVRTFRLDRIKTARDGAGTFEVPTDFSARDTVLAALARTPWRHTVSVRVRAAADAVRARLPVGLATVTPLAEQDWVRVEIRAEQLDWIPGVLAALDADLVVESPEELRDLVAALGHRLLAAAGAVGPVDPGGAQIATTAPA